MKVFDKSALEKELQRSKLKSDAGLSKLVNKLSQFFSRASHYFVSFLSEASAVASGFGYKSPDATSMRSRWEMPVTEPHNIEVPRSMVEVVVSWNIPMHKWLKTCKSF